MKLEKPKNRQQPEAGGPQPWQERDTRGAEEELSRLKKQAEELAQLNQTLEQLRRS